MPTTLADRIAAQALERLPLVDLTRISRRLIESDALARLRWSVATEWQILAHCVRNCTSADDARYAIELHSRPI